MMNTQEPQHPFAERVVSDVLTFDSHQKKPALPEGRNVSS
jgi:hypothetical protein